MRRNIFILVLLLFFSTSFSSTQKYSLTAGFLAQRYCENVSNCTNCFVDDLVAAKIYKALKQTYQKFHNFSLPKGLNVPCAAQLKIKLRCTNGRMIIPKELKKYMSEYNGKLAYRSYEPSFNRRFPHGVFRVIYEFNLVKRKYGKMLDLTAIRNLIAVLTIPIIQIHCRMGRQDKSIILDEFSNGYWCLFLRNSNAIVSVLYNHVNERIEDFRVSDLS